MHPIHPYDLPEAKPLTGGSFDPRRFFSLLFKLFAAGITLLLLFILLLSIQHARWERRISDLQQRIVHGITVDEATALLDDRLLFENLSMRSEGEEISVMSTFGFRAYHVSLQLDGNTINRANWLDLGLRLP